MEEVSSQPRRGVPVDDADASKASQSHPHACDVRAGATGDGLMEMITVNHTQLRHFCKLLHGKMRDKTLSWAEYEAAVAEALQSIDVGVVPDNVVGVVYKPDIRT